jgi:multicomponent Na+:H+ antiporter subunit C
VTPSLFYGLVAAATFGLGLHGVLAARHFLRKILALNVMGSSVFLAFVAVAARGPAGPDPVPQAMVLTGIVVTVAVTGVALGLARRRFADSGETSLPEDRGVKDG